MKYKKLMILLMVGLAMLSACAVQAPAGKALPSESAATATPKPQATPTTGLASGPTIVTAIPGSIGKLATPVTVINNSQPITLTSIQMFDDTEGWAIAQYAGKCEQNQGCILATGNGGAEWQDVTPYGAVSGPLAGVFFLDSRHAWAVFDSASSGKLDIFRTEDHGLNWKSQGSIKTSNGRPGWLYFSDTQHGWLEANLGAAAGSNAVEIWGSTDGGLTWNKLSETPTGPEITSGSLPFSCDKTGISFRDAVDGWATANCAGGQLFLYVTHDGGKTWQPQALPSPAGKQADLFSQCMCNVLSPQFISPETGILAVTIYQDQPETYLYITDDGGKAWKGFKLPVTNLMGSPDFVDSTTGWVTDGVQLFQTQDAGQNWVDLGKLPTQNLTGNLNFTSHNLGWLTDGKQIYTTLDGGQSWNAISPVLIPENTPQVITPTQELSGNGANITLADQGKTITLALGQSFLLDLGEGYNWTVNVDNTQVISREVNVTVIRGAQGIYVARAPGTAKLTASGDPVCRSAQPPCGMPSVIFEITVVVK